MYIWLFQLNFFNIKLKKILYGKKNDFAKNINPKF